jgi:hypothetical protein
LVQVEGCGGAFTTGTILRHHVKGKHKDPEIFRLVESNYRVTPNTVYQQPLTLAVCTRGCL